MVVGGDVKFQQLGLGSDGRRGCQIHSATLQKLTDSHFKKLLDTSLGHDQGKVLFNFKTAL